MGSLSRAQLVAYLKDVDITGRRVLDCGCGPENKHARNWAQGEPAVYHTLDANAEFGPDTIADLNQAIPIFWKDGSSLLDYYDTVFLLETAEHLWNPLAAMHGIHHVLKPGGELYFSAPFINPIHDTVDYLRLTEEWWRKAASVVGFDVDFIRARIATKGLRTLAQFYREEGLRMSKCRYAAGEAHKLAHIGYFGRLVKRCQRISGAD